MAKSKVANSLSGVYEAKRNMERMLAVKVKPDWSRNMKSSWWPSRKWGKITSHPGMLLKKRKKSKKKSSEGEFGSLDNQLQNIS